MGAAWHAEWVKLSRSRVPWLTVLAVTVGAGAGGLFMFISLHPGQARDLGLLAAKAQLAMLAPAWDSYLGLLAQIAAVGGLLIFGMVMVWVFGREFADRTAKDLLALPTSRSRVVAAKFAVAASWCLLLTGYLVVIGMGVGLWLRIPGGAGPVLAAGITRIVVSAALTIGLCTVFGLAASAGRGYLPGIGVMFGALFTAQIVAALGYGPWYPFSVPALHAGLTGEDTPSAFGYAMVGAVAAASVWATARWWQHADHTQ